MQHGVSNSHAEWIWHAWGRSHSKKALAYCEEMCQQGVVEVAMDEACTTIPLQYFWNSGVFPMHG
jgi:hypothetical protein